MQPQACGLGSSHGPSFPRIRPGACEYPTLPNIGIPHYIGVPHRVSNPYSPMLPSVPAAANAEGVYSRTSQTLFEIILLPQRPPRSFIAVIASPLILRTRGDVHTTSPTCPLQEIRAHVSPTFSDAIETCIRLPQLFSFKRDVNTSSSTLPTKGDVLACPPTFLPNSQYCTSRRGFVGLGLEHTCRSGSIVLGLQRTCRAGSSLLGLYELDLPGSIVHLAAG